MNNMALCDDCIVLNECDCRECMGKMIKDLSNYELVSLYEEKQTSLTAIRNAYINNCNAYKEDSLLKKVMRVRTELAKIIDIVDERAEEENISVVEFYRKYETIKTECKFCGEMQICINSVCDDCKHIPDTI